MVEVRGHYRDALLVKRNRVVVWLVECLGGIAPEPFARLRRHARLAKTRGAVDRTKYGTSRSSPGSYLTHHTQGISAAVVRANAKNMRNQIAASSSARASLKRGHASTVTHRAPPCGRQTAPCPSVLVSSRAPHPL